MLTVSKTANKRIGSTIKTVSNLKSLNLFSDLFIKKNETKRLFSTTERSLLLFKTNTIISNRSLSSSSFTLLSSSSGGDLKCGSSHNNNSNIIISSGGNNNYGLSIKRQDSPHLKNIRFFSSLSFSPKQQNLSQLHNTLSSINNNSSTLLLSSISKSHKLKTSSSSLKNHHHQIRSYCAKHRSLLSNFHLNPTSMCYAADGTST